MRKSLRRALERLRGWFHGKARRGASIRGGIEEPQRMRAPDARARVRPQG